MARITKTQRAARDRGRDLGAELVQAVRDLKAGRAGRSHRVDTTDAVAARLRLGLTQPEFAALLDISVRTLQDWEQGRRQPSAAARALLKVATVAPAAVREALGA